MDRAEYLSKLHAQFGVAPTDVVNVIQRATGRTVAASRRLIRGDENEVHRVELTDGSVVYLRASFPGTPPSKVHHEAWAMSRARNAGVPAPEVLATDTINTDDGERTMMVIDQAPGMQLYEVLPSLDDETRSTVMAEVGRVLRVLHSISMPGAGVPDVEGVWTDPETRHRQYVEDCLAACEQLPNAGLTSAEVHQVAQVLQRSADINVDDPVLCHSDVSAEHIFVDAELRIVGLIDWGMWHAGPAASELAGLWLTRPTRDLEAILIGHGETPTDPVLRHRMAWHAIARATGEIAWLTSSGQTAEIAKPVAALKHALAAIDG